MAYRLGAIFRKTKVIEKAELLERNQIKKKTDEDDLPMLMCGDEGMLKSAAISMIICACHGRNQLDLTFAICNSHKPSLVSSQMALRPMRMLESNQRRSWHVSGYRSMTRTSLSWQVYPSSLVGSARPETCPRNLNDMSSVRSFSSRHLVSQQHQSKDSTAQERAHTSEKAWRRTEVITSPRLGVNASSSSEPAQLGMFFLQTQET